MPLIKCPDCGTEISDAAPTCPKCGRPNKPAATPKPKGDLLDPKKNFRVLIRLVILLAILGGGIWFAYKLNVWKPDDSTNRTGLGRALVPWPERAETHLRTMFTTGTSKQNVADSIVSITHPSGKSAKMSDFQVRRVGEQLSVRFDVDWKGGIIGSAYHTTVVWEFTKAAHIAAKVTDDNAATSIADPNRKQLDEFFRTEVYAVLRSNLGD